MRRFVVALTCALGLSIAIDAQIRLRVVGEINLDLAALTALPLLTKEMVFGQPDGGFCPPITSTGGVWMYASPPYDMAIGTGGTTLYLSSTSDWQHLTTQINIPALVMSTTTTSGMNVAAFTQANGLVEITEGLYQAEGAPGVCADYRCLQVPTALHVYNGNLYGTEQYFYDATGVQTDPFFRRPTNLLTTGSVVGMDHFTGQGVAASFNITRMMTAGMSNIPTEWRAALGGNTMAFAGGTYSIISSQSYGPSAFAIDAGQIDGSASVKPAYPLVFYPGSHQTLGGWDEHQPGEMFDVGAGVKGGVMIDGTRTTLFVGRTGNNNCYGPGLSDPKDPLIGTPYPPPSGPFKYCYDPTSSDEGNHAYPYKSTIWAYDTLQLAQVKAGTLNPWAVLPYAYWDDFAFPIPNGPSSENWMHGIDYNPATQRLWITQGNATCRGTLNSIIWGYTVDITP